MAAALLATLFTLGGCQGFAPMEPPPPDGPGRYRELSISGSSACAVREDGTLACHTFAPGTPGYDDRRPPAGTYRHVSAPCGVRSDGSIACWNGPWDGEPEPIPSGDFERVATGSTAVRCALRTDHTLACWSRGGSLSVSSPAGRYLDVDVGQSAACAIREDDGAVVCWAFRICSGLPPCDLSPVESSPLAGAGFRSLSIRDERVGCAIAEDGSLACWGESEVPTGNDFVRVRIEESAHCAVREGGALECWSQAISATPPAAGIADVGVGMNVHWALTTEGSIVPFDPVWLLPPPPSRRYVDYGGSDSAICFGRDDGSWVCAYTDVQQPEGRFRTVLADNGGGLCGLRDEGAIECWGEGASTPPSGTFVDLVHAGPALCALGEDGSIVCWGAPGDPAGTPPTGTFAAIRGAGNSACALDEPGAIACWGTSFVVESAPEGNGFIDVAMSSGSETALCAVQEDGAAACFGTRPIEPPPGSYAEIAIGSPGLVCGRLTDGAITCASSSGTLELPEDLRGVTAARVVDCSGSGSGIELGDICAITSDGDVVGLVLGSDGTLTIPTWLAGR